MVSRRGVLLCLRLSARPSSIAIGLFEGQMRKMADAFAVVRRAELLVDGGYDAELSEPALQELDWHRFTDEERGFLTALARTCEQSLERALLYVAESRRKGSWRRLLK